MKMWKIDQKKDAERENDLVELKKANTVKVKERKQQQ